MGHTRPTDDEPDPTAVAAFDVAPELFLAGSAHQSDGSTDNTAGHR